MFLVNVQSSLNCKQGMLLVSIQGSLHCKQGMLLVNIQVVCTVNKVCYYGK